MLGICLLQESGRTRCFPNNHHSPCSGGDGSYYLTDYKKNVRVRTSGIFLYLP